jgi:hypothetical protein
MTISRFTQYKINLRRSICKLRSSNTSTISTKFMDLDLGGGE